MTITICYITCRREPRIDWFMESVTKEWELKDWDTTQIVVVDHWRDTRPFEFHHADIRWTNPKPSVWSGKHRLTSKDYFSPANARNTGLCLAPDGYIVYVDDLSVILPGWWGEVKKAVAGGYVACGTYQKVNKLVVEKGIVKSFEDHPSGHDSRAPSFQSDEPFKCGGSWMFGCSLAIPVEALLSINGYDEDCDSMGGEDYLCGIMLARAGADIRMCPRMKTLESEEDHHVEKPFKRIIKPHPGYKDASHAILDWTLNGNRTVAPNYQSMRDTRKIMLADGEWPIIQSPEHDWRDGQPLKEM